MCFTSITITNKDDYQLAKCIALSLWFEYKKDNRDGAAYRHNNKVVRTLDYNEFWNYYSQESHTGLSHLHLRLATSAVKKEFIHLWNIGGAYCAHNGVLYNIKDEDKFEDEFKNNNRSSVIRYSGYNRNKSDSLIFFKTINDHIANRDIKGISKALEYASGTAVLTISYPDNWFIVASNSKCIKVSLVNKKALVFSSDDVVLYKSYTLVKEKSSFNYKGHIFEENEKETIILTDKDYTISTIEYNDCVMLCDPEGCIIDKVEVKKTSYRSFSYYY